MADRIGPWREMTGAERQAIDDHRACGFDFQEYVKCMQRIQLAEAEKMAQEIERQERRRTATLFHATGQGRC
jgi:hypothetical protein